MTRTAAALLAALTVLPAPSLARERAEIPPAYRWDLSAIFPSDQAWEEARAALAKRVPSLERHRGKLGESPAALRAALDDVYGALRELERVHVYASARSDEDVRAARPRQMRQTAERLAVDLDAATSFLRPELLALPAEKVRAFLEQDPGLAQYRFPVEDVLRWKPHTRSAGEERVLAQAGNLTSAGSAVQGVLANADLPYREVKLSTGEAVRMDPSAFTLHRASRVKADRDLAFDSFFGALKGFERTFGTTLDQQVKAHVFTQQARGFGSTLESALFRDAIPPAVYRQLVADVRRSLPTFHRYLALRKRMLGVEKLRYQDLYVPMVEKVDLRFEPDQARAQTLAAVAPLGKEYVEGLRTGMEARWTDYLPSTGKRSGAYSTGVYGVGPVQLLNFNGLYEDLSTLAHEAGHSMHTWLAMRAQPYATYDYPIFVAEVASTLNENLLLHHMLGQTKDDATRLFLLGSHLDGLRGTLFRQTQFAEFELAIHEKAEKGEPLTGEALSELYLRIVRDYYGHAQGVTDVPDLVAIEWAFIPHFYYDFYVYQYATSMVASSSIAKAMREDARKGRTAARDRYLAMLRAGGSKFPMDLLREAGVDMTTSKPFDAAIAEMNATMDEMERLLARQPRAAPGKTPAKAR
jgi:oligoendopeptidase F